ncbi:MAG: tRNA (guanine(10)-N(2))-dimethyltransferase [Desulfurococcales archaeon]|nr:tRNA (guanine(10)-N(2))-dimethyltransferase [Desulfurococcales archaeon]
MAADAVVAEGRALVWIPDPTGAVAGRRLEPAWLPVFYNPVMEFNRDLSVVALQAYIDLYAPHKPVTIVEPLTATGVRSVRYALEVEGVGRVIAGDIDPEAVEYAARNVRSNGVEDVVEVRRADASALLYRVSREEGEPVLVVDLDPFGSPAPFMDAALAAIGHRGLLAVTATDLAVLEGSKRRVALRRYHVRIERIPQAREIALRVLLGYAARVAAAHDKALRPLLAYWADHYVRAYMLVERGARAADRMLEECIAMARWCRDLGHPLFEGCPTPTRAPELGPLWACDLGDEDFAARLARLAPERYGYLASIARIKSLVSVLLEELPLSRGRFYYETWALAASLKIDTPSRRGLAEELESRGWRSSPTHLSPAGLRSDAPLVEVVDAAVKLYHHRRGARGPSSRARLEV